MHFKAQNVFLQMTEFWLIFYQSTIVHILGSKNACFGVISIISVYPHVHFEPTCRKITKKTATFKNKLKLNDALIKLSVKSQSFAEKIFVGPKYTFGQSIHCTC